MINDLRFAARTLLRSPALTAVAIATLALGIGANCAVFALVNSVLLRPLPYADPNRVVMVFERAQGFDHGNVSGHEFVAWRDQNRSFDHLAMLAYAGFTLTGRGEPLTISARSVSADFFAVVGQRPLIGRLFQPGDDQPGAARLVVLGNGLWRSRFGSDSSIVGQRILLDDTPFDVIGILPTLGDLDADAWVAMDVVAEAWKVGKHSNLVFGKLKPGVSMRGAESDLGVIAHRLELRLPDANKGHGVHVASLYEEIVGDVRRPFLVALGAAMFVLLLACANVGHLLLTRAAARQRELAIRSALGAERWRIVRLLCAEALLLATAAGVLGLLISIWLTDLLPALTAVRLPRSAEITGTDWHVFLATAALCVVAGLACGVLPVVRFTSPKLKLWLGDGLRTTGGPGRRIASILVVSEVAIALILLIGASLTIKSFVRLVRVDPGFDPRHVLAVALPLPGPKYAGAEQQRRAVGRLLDDLARAPGVQFAGATTTLPLGDCCNNVGITIEGRPAPPPGAEIEARLTTTAGRYFEAMAIPLRRGRLFAMRDARLAVPLIRWYPQQPFPARFAEPQPAPVAVISETMARRHWPNEDALGKRFRIIASPWITVIGIVGDVRQSALVEPPTPQLYLSDLQEPIGAMTLVLRTAAEPASVIPTVRDRVHELDVELPIGSVATMDQTVWRSIGRPRFNAILLGASGLIALLLAVIGIYGVISYTVQRRTHEIGIRRALGAQTSDVLRLMLMQVAGLVAGGLVVGLAGALALTRVLESLLYDVRPDDLATFAGVAACLAGVAILASYLPGRRATEIDPAEALRID